MNILSISAKFILFTLISIPLYSYALIIGVGGHPEGFNGTAADYVSLLQKYNMQSLRTDYLWSEVEKNKGFYGPVNTRTEAVINASYRKGVSSLLILGYGNNYYSNGKPRDFNTLSAYVNYVSWTSNHFKGRKYIYEIWNEWPHRNKNNFEPISKESAQDYFNLVKAASKAIRKNDPSAIILAGGFNPIDGYEKKWAFNLIKLGIMDYIDGLSIHPYAYVNRHLADPKVNLPLIQQFYYKAKTLSNNKPINLYITEVGYPTYNGDGHFNQADVEKYAREYFHIIDQLPFIKGVWWYDLKDDGDDKYNKEHNFGIMDYKLKNKALGNFFMEKKQN
ncbi:cellulase family glycosylhydrolase [Pluralibacter gergoviae]|uniref:cellulase family glycosylhydrolase n=1 Tax=Pluralibacter gergoviae TaxID=61647 RepID=UPI00190E3A3B|nr:cellulase family glycosylhydrolase [Pluralibacter gergoviae]EKT9643559.1 cellulase family glycosylhydrolase [Pluralibacter gergoviae]EMD1656842.1 cellulase family glycosylhydrolase [Pluralibacter gergoviae]MBK4118576.1 cellulase family glycosylhydrolase [Pluralibacter gergoviae]